MDIISKKIIISEEDPAVIYLKKRDRRLAKLISSIGSIECNTHVDGFEFIVGQIIGQQLSIRVATSIFQKLLDYCGGNITPTQIELLDIDEIKKMGISNQKAGYIKNLANLIENYNFSFAGLEKQSDEDVYKRLMSLKGVGSWTSKMYMIFVLQRQDILPYEDVAFLQSYKWLYKTDKIDKESICKKCKKWKPYSSIAARYLYRALDMGLTKEEFHLYK